ncbi:alpha amylase N-terminal ig-like domain-containing protein, partial [Thermococcus sp.]
MYKIFGFERDRRFGRVAMVEFSTPAKGEPYAYLLGSFNAFNEGSFRMVRSDDRWKIKVRLPEGVWYYAFSLGGEFKVDSENPVKRGYKRPSYKFEREASVAEVRGPGRLFHRPSLTYLYSFAGRTHVILRTARNSATSATLSFTGEKVEMRPKARDELFEYWEAVLPGEGALEYSFEVETAEGFEKLGPFSAVPESLEAPAWVLERVFYQVMPDRFAVGIAEKELPLKGESFYGGDLRGLREHLDHLKGLGINAIYLTPIFESMTYHGYDVTDYFHTAERLGGDGEFDALVRELEGFDVRLILDGVFHHTSFFHPYFQDLIRNGENSRYRDFYRPLKFPV